MTKYTIAYKGGGETFLKCYGKIPLFFLLLQRNLKNFKADDIIF